MRIWRIDKKSYGSKRDADRHQRSNTFWRIRARAPEARLGWAFEGWLGSCREYTQ